MNEYGFDVDGIRCEGCANKIKENFKNNDLIDSVEVSVDQAKVYISGKGELSGVSLKKELETLGYTIKSFKKVSQ